MHYKNWILKMRNAFIEYLVEAAKTQKNIALVVGDLGFSVIEPFADMFPERFFNAGVAEQNMMGLCAGLASEGFHVFAYSIANFPTFRCAEQIRNDVDYHELPVTIVAVGGGLSYGNLGYSHHAIQDYALMRSFPNMLIASPGDPMETRGCMRYLLENPQPSYLRLNKAGERNIHAQIPEVSPGCWLEVQKGLTNNGHAFLTTGAALQIMYELQESINISNDYGLYSMPLWGMKFKENQHQNISKFLKVCTVEDHLQDGGFGSWVMESISNSVELRQKVRQVSLSSQVCGKVGSQKNLNNIGGLNKDALIAAINS